MAPQKVCRNWQQSGACKYGQKCSFLHTGAGGGGGQHYAQPQGGRAQQNSWQQQQQQQRNRPAPGNPGNTQATNVPRSVKAARAVVTEDMREDHRPAWPFVSYAADPKSPAPDVGGGDYAPSELRWEAYRAVTAAGGAGDGGANQLEAALSQQQNARIQALMQGVQTGQFQVGQGFSAVQAQQQQQQQVSPFGSPQQPQQQAFGQPQGFHQPAFGQQPPAFGIQQQHSPQQVAPAPAAGGMLGGSGFQLSNTAAAPPLAAGGVQNLVAGSISLTPPGR